MNNKLYFSTFVACQPSAMQWTDLVTRAIISSPSVAPQVWKRTIDVIWYVARSVGIVTTCNGAMEIIRFCVTHRSDTRVCRSYIYSLLMSILLSLSCATTGCLPFKSICGVDIVLLLEYHPAGRHSMQSKIAHFRVHTKLYSTQTITFVLFLVFKSQIENGSKRS